MREFSRFPLVKCSRNSRPGSPWGPGRGDYLTKFNTGRLRPEVQPLTLLYTILREKIPLLYSFYCWALRTYGGGHYGDVGLQDMCIISCMDRPRDQKKWPSCGGSRWKEGSLGSTVCKTECNIQSSLARDIAYVY